MKSLVGGVAVLAAALLVSAATPAAAFDRGHAKIFAVLPDGSVAFVLSRSEPRLSVVDLRRGVLLTNLQLAGKASEMLLKPDGGELYVTVPDLHQIEIIGIIQDE